MNILVTGGCGFVGCHSVTALIQAGHQVTVVDNFSNSSPLVAKRIELLTGEPLRVHAIDVAKSAEVEQILLESDIEAIVHFAGYKHVRDSVGRPLEYFENNIGGLLALLRASQDTPVRKFVFSSSGSIYGETPQMPINESRPPQPSNPYSKSKAVCEEILRDVCIADMSWSVVSLRYFNPAGAHSSAILGEWSTSEASNLLPVLLEVAAGTRPFVNIYGRDFDTPDGSGVRDYVHVEDVAETHVRAVSYLEECSGYEVLNVGRGKGVSVLELIRAVENVTGVDLKRVDHPRRAGDVSSLVGETSKSNELFGDMEYRSLHEIVESAWNWRTKNANGYES